MALEVRRPVAVHEKKRGASAEERARRGRSQLLFRCLPRPADSSKGTAGENPDRVGRSVGETVGGLGGDGGGKDDTLTKRNRGSARGLGSEAGLDHVESAPMKRASATTETAADSTAAGPEPTAPRGRLIRGRPQPLHS